jgi:hypothetical protein
MFDFKFAATVHQAGAADALDRRHRGYDGRGGADVDYGLGHGQGGRHRHFSFK